LRQKTADHSDAAVYSQEDLEAIYAFLSAIPSATPGSCAGRDQSVFITINKDRYRIVAPSESGFLRGFGIDKPPA